jgi:hypothetical protein
MAVVIPSSRYEVLERSRKRLIDMIEEVHERNKDVPYEVIQKEIDEAIREVRAEYRADKTAAKPE